MEKYLKLNLKIISNIHFFSDLCYEMSRQSRDPVNHDNSELHKNKLSKKYSHIVE